MKLTSNLLADDEMTDLQCPTCLRLDRKHFPLDITKYGSLFDNKIMQNVHTVCWECINIFHKVYKFKQQIVLAQEYLTNTSEKLPTLAPLNHLICSTINIYDICCNLSMERISNLQVTNDLIQNIKSIWIDEDENNDSEYSYDVSLRVITTDENDTLDRDINNSNIKNQNVSVKLFCDDTTLKKLPVKNEDWKKKLMERKAKLEMKKKKIKKEKLKPPKLSYTIINMTENEMLAKRVADRQTDKYMNKVKYRCELCILGFFNKNLYEQHMKCKHSEKAGPHQCPICEVRFRNLNFFKEHVQRHYQKYQCLICPFIGYKVTKMASHQANKHDVRKLVCKVCGEEFTSIPSLRIHRKKTHEAPPKCQNCGKTFTTMSGLRVHILKIHNNIPKTKCTVCGISVRYLRNHMRKHRAAPEAAYCVECDIRFSSSSCYKAHLKFASKHRTDTVLREICKLCNAKFASAWCLKEHTLASHSTEHVQLMICDHCGKGYKSRHRLSEHLLYTHGGVPKPKDKICHFCGKGFHTKETLISHIRLHTGEKPFQCELCSAAFTHKSSLKTHMRGVHLKLNRST